MDHIIGEVLANTAEFDHSTKMTLHTSSAFKPDASYWAREKTDWPHRQSMWIWIAGAVPGRLTNWHPIRIDFVTPWHFVELHRDTTPPWRASELALCQLGSPQQLVAIQKYECEEDFSRKTRDRVGRFCDYNNWWRRWASGLLFRSLSWSKN